MGLGMTRNARRIGAWAVGLALLAAVFALYLQPDMMLALATQLWSCF
jgi:hypothetical protein